jgi:hypothetical protein
MDSAAPTQPVSECPAGQYARCPASTMFVTEDEDWDFEHEMFWS